MKSLALNQVAGLFITADTITTTYQNHDSVNIATLVMKENRESLLMKLPEVTL